MKLQKVLAVALASYSVLAQADYSMTVDPTGKMPPSFSLALPEKHGDTLVTRSTPSQVKNPRCGDQQLEALGPGRWRVPATCRRVDWQLEFEAPAKTNVIGQLAENSVAFPGWWSIADQSSLLHLDGDKTSSQMTIRMPGQGDRQALVPSINDAPEFYAVGHPQETVRQIDGVQIRYVADHLDEVTRRGLLDMHAEAFKALRPLFPPPKGAAFANELLVILVRNTDPGVSGAGGARSLVMAYPAQVQAADAFTLMTLAHEQFHQISALYNDSNSGADWPADHGLGSPWFSEALAEYYGLKTVRQSSVPNDAKMKVWQVFVDPKRPVTAGLVALNRRFAAGDASVYPLFYSQGATFFAELDQMLQKASGGRKSLDDFVPVMRSEADGRLPSALLAQWRAIAGPGVDALVARYVGQ